MYSPPKSWNPITINFHYYVILWKTAVAAPRWIDKIKVWFMPLTWLPQGLPPKENLIETTLDNQVRYSTVMFKNAKPYLILQVIISMILMLLVIKSDTSLTTLQRWVGAFFLWHSIINWSGIMESKKWLQFSEILRLFLAIPLMVWFFNIGSINLVAISFFLFITLSIVWVVKNFRINSNLNYSSI